MSRNQIEVLGSNGTKGQSGGTSAFKIDSANVIDAGNLLRPLKNRCAYIETIWITHSHLDHIADIAFILDSYMSERKKPLTLRALQPTLDALHEHFLNDLIWPNFGAINLNDSNVPSVRYEAITLDEEYSIAQQGYIRAFKTEHTVSSCGYIYSIDGKSIAITADTLSLDELALQMQKDPSIATVVIECSFPNALNDLAIVSKHLTPNLLAKELAKLPKRPFDLYINHIKPLYKEKILSELNVALTGYDFTVVQDRMKIKFN